MEDLDFSRPAQNPLYDAAVARAFFESAGQTEAIAQGKALFVENEKGGKLFMRRDKMYFLLEGEVALSVGGKAIDTIRQGEVFGEMASIADVPRTATATAKSACRVIGLDDRQFQAALRHTPDFALMLMGIMLNRLRLTLASLGMRGGVAERGKGEESRIFDRKQLAELKQEVGEQAVVHQPVNKVIVSEGTTGVFMYAVIEGTVEISIQSKVVERIGAGGIFGEMALVDQGPRVATAIAATDCTLLNINRSDFLALVKSRPEFGLSLLRALAERLRFLTAHFRQAGGSRGP